MKHIVLDSSTILKKPSVLFQQAENVKLYVPASVFFEVGRFNTPSNPEGDFRKLLADASNNHYISFLSETIGGDYPNNLLSRTEASTLIAAYELAKTADAGGVYLATEDKDLIDGARGIGVTPLNIKELESLLHSESSEISVEAEEKTNKLKIENILYLVKNIAISVAVSIFSKSGYGKIDQIFKFLTEWGVFVVVPILGLGLFWLRSKFRLSYGLIEIGVGIFAATRVVFPISKIPTLEAVAVIQFLGGLYIMVRGLDNIEKGLKGTRFLPYWRYIFSET